MKSCKGAQPTIDGLQKELADTRIAMNAARALDQMTVPEPNPSSITNIQTQNIHQGDINNIQVNLIVRPVREENRDYIREMSIEELMRRIGGRPDETTPIELFKLVRCDENHPENHNMLLPSLDSKTVSWNSPSGWKDGAFDEHARSAIAEDGIFLGQHIPRERRDHEFFENYLMRTLLPQTGAKDHKALRKIFDGIRRPLYETTMRLAAKYSPESQIETESQASEACPSEQTHVADDTMELIQAKIQLVIEQKATAAQEAKRASEEAKRASEEARRLEAETTLLRLKQEMQIVTI